MIITGLRGVGKTVLLGELRIRAETQGWVAVEAEITRHPDFRLRMAQLTRRSLPQLPPKARWKDPARRTASVLKSLTITVSPNGALAAGLDIEAAEGMADSGEIVQDLADLVVALGEVAKESPRGVVFLFDEIQHLSRVDFEAVIAALHKSVQRALPVTLVGAGLPQMPRLAGEAKSYSERLLRFPSTDRLPREQAVRALVQPAPDLAVAFTVEAAAEIVAYTEGYPYFIHLLHPGVRPYRLGRSRERADQCRRRGQRASTRRREAGRQLLSCAGGTHHTPGAAAVRRRAA